MRISVTTVPRRDTSVLERKAADGASGVFVGVAVLCVRRGLLRAEARAKDAPATGGRAGAPDRGRRGRTARRQARTDHEQHPRQAHAVKRTTLRGKGNVGRDERTAAPRCYTELMLRLATACGAVFLAACSGQAADHADASEPTLPACSWDASLHHTDGLTNLCFAARTNTVCTGVNGCTVECLVDDPSQCPGPTTSSCSASPGSGLSASADSGSMACEDTCKASEYAIECEMLPDHSGFAPPPSACRADTTAPASAEAEFYCCPCGM